MVVPLTPGLFSPGLTVSVLTSVRGRGFEIWSRSRGSDRSGGGRGATQAKRFLVWFNPPLPPKGRWHGSNHFEGSKPSPS